VTGAARDPVDRVELSRRMAPVLVVAAVLTWGLAAVAGGRRPEPDLGPFLRRAFPGARFERAPHGIVVARAGGTVLGYATAGVADGYSGPIAVAVATGPDGRTRALALLEHRDTPAIARSGLPLLSSLLGKAADEPFRLGEDVDAVTGATSTSRGLAGAVRAGTGSIASHVLARGGARGEDVVFGPPEGVVLVLLVVAAAAQGRRQIPSSRRRALRIATLLASLGLVGFLFARPWVIAFPIRLLSGDWPSWRTHLYWYVLLAGTLLTFSRAGRSPYCPWVCPFGAAQDVLGLAGGAHRRRLPLPLLFAWIKGGLLWLAVLLGLLYRNPAAASYEVFGAFFRLSGTGIQIALLAIVLAASVFYTRPFCHWVCPVDAVERILRPLRRRLVGAAPRTARRPLRRADSAPHAVGPVFRRLRRGLLVTVGVLCAALVIAHLARFVPGRDVPGERGLVGETFVSVEQPAR
jgi:NosR/NirI family nitrous oxide reductase transcriptional regulator